ncbi:MAG: methyltransferase domain-containing protein [Actinobacteria bacterium]|nr:MAG: methyltransferase domain-containing protein [Actinomycetota bacterium]
MAPARLNLGSGTDVREGYVNLDIAALPGVDVVHDLSQLPLPFDDGQFEEVLCKDILEHLDYVPVLRELHRIITPGGRLIVEAPHFTSPSVYIDPTHKTAFSIETLDFFCREGHFAGRSYYFDFHFDHIESARIVFHRYRGQPWNYLVEPLVNRSPGAQRFYEETALGRFFPASNIRVVIVR